MSSRSLARKIAFGGSRGPLVAISAAGYVLQFLAFQDYYAHSGGDGWRELGPGLAIFVFCPVQLCAAVSVLLAFAKAVSEHAANEVAPPQLPPGVSGYGLDRDPLELEGARRVARVSTWTLSVPAAVMASLTLLEWFDSLPPGATVLAGPMSVVWLPAWLSGVVAAVIALNRLSESSGLWLAGLYPVLVFLYAHA